MSEAAHDVSDLGLAGAGRVRIETARRRMPVLSRLAERFGASRRFEGVRIGASLHVTAETAVLLSTLRAGGAEVAVCASNPLSTKDDVAASLVSDEGIATYARRGEEPSDYLAHLDAVLATRPTLTVDDGCDLIARVHRGGAKAAAGILGGTEDTTTGAVRLRALAAAGELSYPVLALAGAATRALADHRHGTGQSTIDGIVRATNVLFAGTTVVVAGYGNCGKAVASRARGLGAIVVVTEIDPLAGLEAVMDGFRVLPMDEAAPLGHVIVTATGNRDVVRAEHFSLMPDGAILANAGQFDVEIDVAGLAAAARRRRRLGPSAEEYDLGDRRLTLLAEGRLVNLAAADGHPPEVMDISCSVQALACSFLVSNARALEPVVHEPPSSIDEEVARLKLEAIGVHLDEPTPEQLSYVRTWDVSAS